jgi:hypothetical protein
MRKVLVSLILCIFFINVHSQIVTWDGEANDGMWSNELNWSNNTLPGQNDEVVLDNSVLSDSYNVTLPGISTTVGSLRITPNTGNTIIVLLPTTNTLISDAFITTASGYVFIIDEGGVFINNAIVSSGTNLTISDSLKINDGGRYIHRTRSGHSAWVSRLSRVPGTARGVIEFDVPVSSFLLSLSGRVFGTLVLSTATHGGPVTYSGSGAQNCNVRGDLRLEGSAMMTLNFTAGQMIIHNEFHQSVSSTFNLQTSVNNNIVRMKGNVFGDGLITKTGSGIPELIFNGTQNQSISIKDSINADIIVSIDNIHGVNIIQPLYITMQLKLTNGRIRTSPAAMITLADGATISDLSSESFIDGPIRKIGDEAFVFPIGKGLQKSSLGISGGVDPSDEYIAEYYQGNPKNVYGQTFETPAITQMSSLEWWTLEKISGTTPREVTLNVTTYSDATMLEHLRVLRFDGNTWLNEGNSTFTGLSFGPVTSNPIGDFFPSGSPTPFTIGSSVATVNPLNTELVRFEAERISESTVRLEWEVAEIPPVEERFYIERQTREGFQTIGTVHSNLNSKIYDFIDHEVQEGRNLYRLRFTVAGGGPGYSRIVSILKKNPSFTLNKVESTYNTLRLELESEKSQRAEIFIVEGLGRIIYRKQYSVGTGNNLLYCSKLLLSSGVYHVIAVADTGERSTRSFVYR